MIAKNPAEWDGWYFSFFCWLASQEYIGCNIITNNNKHTINDYIIFTTCIYISWIEFSGKCSHYKYVFAWKFVGKHVQTDGIRKPAELSVQDKIINITKFHHHKECTIESVFLENGKKIALLPRTGNLWEVWVSISQKNNQEAKSSSTGDGAPQLRW